MTNPIDPAAFQAFLAQLAAQQSATPAAEGVAYNVTPAEPAAEVEPTVDIELGDVLGRGGYGPSLFTGDDKIGTSFTGTVAQETIVKQQREYRADGKPGKPKFYDDGKTPVPQLLIGLDVPVSERHPEGRATWYARGKDIPEVSRAMAEAGVPRELIKKGLEVGATVTVTYSADRKNPNYPNGHAAKIRTVQYTRPGQPAGPVTPAVATPTAQLPVATVQVPATPGRPEGLTDEQYQVFLKALGQQAA